MPPEDPRKQNLGENVSDRMRARAKKNKKKYRFLATRMWINTAISALWPDKGLIPKDIGDRLFIGNNVVITKNGLRGYIQIEEWSEKTPLSVTTRLTKYVKGKVPEVRVDAEMRCVPYTPDLTDPAVKAQEKMWERGLSDDSTPDRIKNRFARLLYSLERMRAGEELFKVVTTFTFIAQNYTVLKRAVKIALGFLHEREIECTHVKTGVHLLFPFIALFMNREPRKTYALPWLVFSSQTLAESLPVTQGMNSDRGVFLGIDRNNKAPYFLDFQSFSGGKNIYIVSKTGAGKTFLALNWLLTFFAQGYCLCVMDLKGNEFTTITKACGGKIVSMRPDAAMYVNTFKMSPNKAEGNPEVYFKEHLGISKRMLSIICDFTDEEKIYGEAFIEEFLRFVYIQRGVSAGNVNTWARTRDLTPYMVYSLFKSYISNDIKATYGRLLDKISMAFDIYLSPQGSGSGIFRNEYVLDDILDSKVICFDYGMLNSNRITDVVLFRLKILFMMLINDEFIRHKKKQKLWTVKVLEESQIADSFLLRVYKEELTLRRAQNQVTILIGNSVAALRDSQEAKAIFENITMLAIGRVSKSSRDILVPEFGLEDEAETLTKICNNPAYEHTFLFINKAQRSTTALLEVYVPRRVADGPIFKNVDVTEDDENS